MESERRGMLWLDRCPVVRTYSTEGGKAVLCWLERDHRARNPDEWHLSEESGYRASWPHKLHHCYVTHMADTADGPVKVWCGRDPDGHHDHEGMCGMTPVRWRTGP